MKQLEIDFKKDKEYGGQLKRLFDLLTLRPVTCEDCETLGIAGSALPRRIKDLKDNYQLPITIGKKDIIRRFDGRKVTISQYFLNNTISHT